MAVRDYPGWRCGTARDRIPSIRGPSVGPYAVLQPATQQPSAPACDATALCSEIGSRGSLLPVVEQRPIAPSSGAAGLIDHDGPAAVANRWSTLRRMRWSSTGPEYRTFRVPTHSGRPGRAHRAGWWGSGSLLRDVEHGIEGRSAFSVWAWSRANTGEAEGSVHPDLPPGPLSRPDGFSAPHGFFAPLGFSAPLRGPGPASRPRIASLPGRLSRPAALFGFAARDGFSARHASPPGADPVSANSRPPARALTPGRA